MQAQIESYAKFQQILNFFIWLCFAERVIQVHKYQLRNFQALSEPVCNRQQISGLCFKVRSIVPVSHQSIQQSVLFYLDQHL